MLLRTVLGRRRALVRPLAGLAPAARAVSSPAAAAPPSASSESDSGVLVERRPIPGHTAGYMVITLNRPKQSNALDMALLHDLQGVFDTLPTDKSIRCVVLTGSGHAFCGGHDLYQMHHAQGNKAVFERMFARCSRFMLSIQRVPQPVIAAVNGLATGAGCQVRDGTDTRNGLPEKETTLGSRGPSSIQPQLVAACDLAIASDRATFGTSGVKLGLFCATPSVPLSRNVGRKRAFKMLVTGDFIDAPTALDWGLVNDVVPLDELDETVEKLVKDISDKPAVAISMGKVRSFVCACARIGWWMHAACARR